MTVLYGMNWFAVSNADPRAVSLYQRHYSSKKNGIKPAKWRRYGITGPGELMTLLNLTGTALFVWQRQLYVRHGQGGVNCAVFRNEASGILSSDLIKEAVGLAWGRWPNERLYTFVDPVAVQGDGYCFKAAGWKRCGKTGGGLIVLELLP